MSTDNSNDRFAANAHSFYNQDTPYIPVGDTGLFAAKRFLLYSDGPANQIFELSMLGGIIATVKAELYSFDRKILYPQKAEFATVINRLKSEWIAPTKVVLSDNPDLKSLKVNRLRVCYLRWSGLERLQITATGPREDCTNEEELIRRIEEAERNQKNGQLSELTSLPVIDFITDLPDEVAAWKETFIPANGMPEIDFESPEISFRVCKFEEALHYLEVWTDRFSTPTPLATTDKFNSDTTNNIRLSHPQIAILYHINEQPITKNNANDVARRYGQTSGQKLIQEYESLTSELVRTSKGKYRLQDYVIIEPCVLEAFKAKYAKELAETRKNNIK